MNRIAAIAALTAVLLVCAGVCPAPASAEEVGQFEQVINQVDHLKQGQSPARAAKVPDGVANLDMVRTQEQSRAKLGFLDDTKMTVGPKTELTIEVGTNYTPLASMASWRAFVADSTTALRPERSGLFRQTVGPALATQDSPRIR